MSRFQLRDIARTMRVRQGFHARADTKTWHASSIKGERTFTRRCTKGGGEADEKTNKRPKYKPGPGRKHAHKNMHTCSRVREAGLRQAITADTKARIDTCICVDMQCPASEHPSHLVSCHICIQGQ